MTLLPCHRVVLPRQRVVLPRQRVGLRRGRVVVRGSVLLVGFFLAFACGSSPPPAPAPAPVVAPAEPPQPPPAPPAAPPAEQTSNYGVVSLAPGFAPDPHLVSGHSGGTIDATTLSASCAGWISGQPDHLFVAEAGFARLRIMALSELDVTLVVEHPDGSWSCDDDSELTNPVVTLVDVPAGTYRVWVGSYDANRTGEYRLGLSELDSTLPSHLNASF